MESNVVMRLRFKPTNGGRTQLSATDFANSRPPVSPVPYVIWPSAPGARRERDRLDEVLGVFEFLADHGRAIDGRRNSRDIAEAGAESDHVDRDFLGGERAGHEFVARAFVDHG
jgi:hypothetical protein